MSDLIPNTYQKPNIYSDLYAYYLTPEENVVLDYIIRQILGFEDHRETRRDRISITQICEGKRSKKDGAWLSRGTGLSRPTVGDCIQSLIHFNFIAEVGEPTQDGQEYELNRGQLGDIRLDLLEARKAEKQARDAERGAKIKATKAAKKGSKSHLLVNPINHPGSKCHLPQVVNGIYQGSKSHLLEVVNAINTQNPLETQIQTQEETQEGVAAVAAAPPPPDPPAPAVKPAPKPKSRKPTRTPEQHALQERVVQALEEVTGKPRTVNQSGYQAVGWWLVDSFPDLGETLPEVVRERYAEDAPPADGWQWYTHDFRGMGRKEPSKRPTVFQVRETIYDALQPPPAPTVALTPYTNGHSRDRPASFAGMQIEQSLASIAAMREERLRRETGGT